MDQERILSYENILIIGCQAGAVFLSGWYYCALNSSNYSRYKSFKKTRQ